MYSQTVQGKWESVHRPVRMAMAFDERNRSLTVQGKWESIHRPVRMAMAFDERNRSLEQTLETERQSHRNFRNCLCTPRTGQMHHFGPKATLPRVFMWCLYVVELKGICDCHTVSTRTTTWFFLCSLTNFQTQKQEYTNPSTKRACGRSLCC